jgi:hypothetical protein
MRAGGVVALLVLGAAVACGSRTSLLAPDQSDDAGGNAGVSSRGGKGSTGGKTSRGGNVGVAGTLAINLSGSGSTLGGTSAGGSPCVCELPDECAPGYYREVEPSVCCGGGPCLLDCRDLGCPDIDVDCRPGMHRGTLPGDCCPSCVPDKPSSCEEAKELYENFRAHTFGKYASLSCTPRGCAIAGESNRCAITCGTLVPAVGRDAIEEELALFAEATCSMCPLPTKPVCLPKPPSSCNVTECTFDVPG